MQADSVRIMPAPAESRTAAEARRTAPVEPDGHGRALARSPRNTGSRARGASSTTPGAAA